MPWPHFKAIVATLQFAVGEGLQSALKPKSAKAEHIADISWLMFIGATVLFLLVVLLLALAFHGAPNMRQRLARRWLIVAGGIVLPVVVLSALLVHALATMSAMNQAEKPPVAHIEVMGEMWWWRVRYLDQAGRPLFETANDIRIPAGVPIEFILKSNNVIHSFWVPNLAGKVDMVPGHENRLLVQATGPGLFRGQCAEYCGAQHANMMFEVRALSEDDYQAWLNAQRLPAREPGNEMLQLGKQTAMQACAQCHTIRGTAAAGTLGPDLTHIGSRLSLAAGMLPNNVGTLAGWIAGSQHIKPGNHMPSFDQLTGTQLRAVAQYMESLQ